MVGKWPPLGLVSRVCLESSSNRTAEVGPGPPETVTRLHVLTAYADFVDCQDCGLRRKRLHDLDRQKRRIQRNPCPGSAIARITRVPAALYDGQASLYDGPGQASDTSDGDGEGGTDCNGGDSRNDKNGFGLKNTAERLDDAGKSSSEHLNKSKSKRVSHDCDATSERRGPLPSGEPACDGHEGWRRPSFQYRWPDPTLIVPVDCVGLSGTHNTVILLSSEPSPFSLLFREP